MMTAKNRRRILAFPFFYLALQACAQSQPSMATREQALKSLVHLSAQGCPDGDRSGSGFAIEKPNTIVTAHHVVGGCSKINVRYEGAAGGTPSKQAKVTRVLPKGDIAMLEVIDPPPVPVLAIAPPPPNHANTYAGLGYQNGQISGGDVMVTFSSGRPELASILTPQIIIELSKLNSPIDTSQSVLRFNVALQPGMSGGPIIDMNGAVIGIVAGGLKAGAAPASWGWPATLINALKTSTASISQPVRTGVAYYSLSELQQVNSAYNSREQIKCGNLRLTFRGTQPLQNLLPGADDAARVRHIMNISTMSDSELRTLKFDIWVEKRSGATAVIPAGYEITNESGVCLIATEDDQFKQMIWGGPATTPQEVQQISAQFENLVMAPRVPTYGFQYDPQLTTLSPNGMPGPNFRENGLVFNRKGGMSPKVPFYGPQTPILHSFETLIARSGTFLGVGTINEEVTRDLSRCLLVGMGDRTCAGTRQHVRDWTHFILATQLSTFPVN
jgi:hypothetical protein